MKIDKSKAIASSKRNPCPICEKTHGCKISDNLIMCLRGDSNWSIPGWKYLKPLRGGMGGLFGADSGERQEYRPEQQPKAAKPLSITPLTDEQLNDEARKILKQLGLSAKHREQLHGRGLTDEQIDQLGFKSVDRYQEFNLISISPNFPGMGDKGTLANSGSGILIPAVNIKGLIIGLQIARDDREPKYQHLSGCSKRRVSGERPLPLTKINDSRKLDIAEGFLKSIKSAYLHNINVLGEGGCQWASSPKELMEIVNSNLFDSYVLNPDTGSLLNNNVMGGYRALYLFLKKLGINLLVRDWGQGNKPKSDKIDVDEITTEDFNNASIIPYQEWDLELEKAQQQSTDDWKKQRDYQAKIAWYKNKKYTPDTTYSEPFCKSPKAPNRGEIVCLKYQTGQGKTTIIKHWFLTVLKEFGAIKISYRNSLEQQFSASTNFYQLRDDGQIYISDPKGRTTSCIDSLLKYDDDDFDGKIIIIDEAESVFRHLLYGNTIKDRQQQIIDKLETGFQRCESIILADGILSDEVCSFVEKLSGKKLIKYFNDVLPSRPDVVFYDDIERKQADKLAHQIKGETFPLIAMDSQIDCEALSKDLSIYGRKPLRIDSKTKNDPIIGKEVDRFLSNPDRFLTENEQTKTYDCIIHTPTIESGIDINWKGFSGVYLLLKHLEINSAMQMIIRVRDVAVPRYVSCRGRSIHK